MRFALFCDDLLAKPIVDALGSRVDGHQLSHAVRVTPQSDALLHGQTNVSFVEHWEDLLVARDVEAVIVGGSDQMILDGTKQLGAARIPILFIPRAAQGSTFAYELSLIRDDNNVLLWPLFWHRFDSAVIRLKKVIQAGELGKIQFLQVQRMIGQASAGVPISQMQVDDELLHDVDLPRWMIGDYDQVTGLRTAASNEGVLIQSVVLAGRSLPESNWSINSVEGSDDWKLVVRGEQGVATLRRDGTSRRWICEIGGDQVEGNESETARAALAAFASALPTAAHSANIVTSEQQARDIWGELVKCYETVDATHRSVRRRRTIELHFEPMSERAIFKTQMTAVGCSLLVITFFLTLCYLGIASLIPLPPTALIILRTLVFAPLFVFLAAQILLPLTRPSSAERPPAAR
jgi:hypothetical protein